MTAFQIPVATGPLFTKVQTEVLDDVFRGRRATRDRRAIRAVIFRLCLMRSARGIGAMLLPQISLQVGPEPDGEADVGNHAIFHASSCSALMPLEGAIKGVRAQLALLLTDSAFQRRASAVAARIRTESPAGMKLGAIEDWTLQVHRDFALVHHEQPFYKCVTDAADAGWDLDHDYYEAQFGKNSTRAARAALLAVVDWRAVSHQQNLAVADAAKVAQDMLASENVAVAQVREHLILPNFVFQVEHEDAASRGELTGTPCRSRNAGLVCEADAPFVKLPSVGLR